MSLQHAQCRNCLWKKDCAYYFVMDKKCPYHNTKRQFVSREIVKRKEQHEALINGE